MLPEVASAHAVLDGDVARIPLAIDVGSAIFQFDLAELAERHALTGGRQDPDIGDVFHRFAERRLITDGQIVTLFADQNLADGFAADRGLHCILHVADVDSEAVGGGAVHDEIHIRLAAYLKCAQIGHARNLAHHVLNLVGFGFEDLQIGPEKFDRQFALDAADGFLDVVGNRLRKIPVHAGKFVQLLVHGGDEVVFRFELGPPLRARQQINEELRVVEAAGIAAVIGASHLAYDLLDLGKIGQRQAGLLGKRHPRGGARARSQRAAHPDRAFIQVRQKLGTDHAAETKKQHAPRGPATPIPSVSFRWSKHQSSWRP